MKEEGVQFDDRIVECYWDPHGGPLDSSKHIGMDGNGSIKELRPPAWRLHRIREDKTDGNHTSVVQKIIQSIEDGVEEQQLKDEDMNIRAAWKSEERSNFRRNQAAPSKIKMGPPPPMRGTPPEGLIRR